MGRRHARTTRTQTLVRRVVRGLWWLLPHLLVATTVTITLALPAYQEHQRRERYTEVLEQSGGVIHLPRWRPELAETFPGCSRQPRRLPDHVLAVVDGADPRRMRFRDARAARRSGQDVWVIGYCSR
jgi:hypothetical protein